MSREGHAIHALPVGRWDNLVYLIVDRPTRRCAVVDPAWDAEAILAETARLELEISHLLCTHAHFDHVDKVDALLRVVDAQVHMLREEVEFSGFRCENLVASRPGDVVRVGEHLEITMLHTPGHTPGSVSYRLRDALVTGDTLFVDGCGRCDFVGGDPAVMYETLRGLTASLPGDTVIYPGHDYGPTRSARLDAQLETNPYLRLGSLDDFVAHRMAGKTPNTPLPTPG